jgi:hypothetical protein
MMPDPESPATIFELLHTRAPDDRLMRIIYDNACNAMHYVLNREAKLCERLEFYVDEFHFTGHKACCIAYDTGAPISCACNESVGNI